MKNRMTTVTGLPHRWLHFGLAAMITAFWSALPAIAEPSKPQPPNVLLLLSDDQRPDTIHALGNDVIHTPNLDRLVARGTAFTRAVAANPICTPSRAEIITGATGFRNGVFDFGRKISSDVALWARTMQGAGYRTCYIGKWHNDGLPTQRGYDRTIGLYRGGGGAWAVPSFDWNGKPVTGYHGWVFQTDEGEKLLERGVGLSANISEYFADAAIQAIQEDSDRPFFLHVNFTAPHDPLLMPHGYEGMYDPAKIPLPPNFRPEHPFDHGNFRGRDEQLFNRPRTPEEVRNELAVYYAVISHMDAQIGRILQALDESGQRENTIVIFSSDHGLAVGSHGLRGKQNMYEHTVNVPLMISGPGIPHGQVETAQCYLRDLFPTVCDLAGVEIPGSVEGKSLVPLLRGEATSIYPFTVAYFRSFQRMIRTDDWKLIHYPHLDRIQLFHLKDDPYELNDLSNERQHADVVAELRRTLHQWQKDHGDPVLERASSR